MRQAQYFYTILFILLSAANQSYANTQDLHALEKAAQSHLQAHYKNKAEKIIVTVSALDPRLRLARCPIPVEFVVKDNAAIGGAISLKADCKSSKPWSLYMSAHAQLHNQVVVTTSPLKRGTIIQSHNLKTQLMDTSTLRNGYLTDTKLALGKQLRQPLRVNEPLRQGILVHPIAVKRGDTVRLEVISGNITVTAKAVALANGRVGEKIRVKNISSKRIVTANITKSGRVQAIF